MKKFSQLLQVSANIAILAGLIAVIFIYWRNVRERNLLPPELAQYIDAAIASGRGTRAQYLRMMSDPGSDDERNQEPE